MLRLTSYAAVAIIAGVMVGCGDARAQVKVGDVDASGYLCVPMELHDDAAANFLNSFQAQCPYPIKIDRDNEGRLIGISCSVRQPQDGMLGIMWTLKTKRCEIPTPNPKRK